MSGPARVAVVLISIACVLWALYNAVTPDRYTIGLFDVHAQGGHAQLIVAVPSPAAVPVRGGDELDVPATTVHDRILYFSAVATGSTIHVPVLRAGRAVHLTVVVPPSVPQPPRWIDLILVILEAAFGILVMMRAGTAPLGRMVVWLAIVEEVGTVFTDFAYTAPTPSLAFAIGSVGGLAIEAATSYVVIWAAALLPGGIRKRTPLFAAAVLVVALITETENATGITLAVFFPLLASVWVNVLYAAACVVCLAMAVALWVVAQAAPAEQRMRSMWFVSTLIGWFIGSAFSTVAYVLSGPAWLFWAGYLLQSFTLLGPIYATLRHRILDLNFVVTRSAIYAVLSIFILGSFVGAEWVAGRVSDFVFSGFWRGIAPPLVSFAVAIVIGLYLRTVHAHVEDWVNGILFRERIRRLQLLESFAREADLIQTRSELLRVTYEAIESSIDADDVAVYVAEDRALVRAHGAGIARLERSDRVVLQLLERQRPFVSEVPSLRHWMIIPLAVRRDIVGAIACGPKRDHTEYLPDELRALVDVAQSVATSYALLLPALSPPLDRLSSSTS